MRKAVCTNRNRIPMVKANVLNLQQRPKIILSRFCESFRVRVRNLFPVRFSSIRKKLSLGVVVFRSRLRTFDFCHFYDDDDVNDGGDENDDDDDDSDDDDDNDCKLFLHPSCKKANKNVHQNCCHCTVVESLSKRAKIRMDKNIHQNI